MMVRRRCWIALTVAVAVACVGCAPQSSTGGYAEGPANEASGDSSASGARGTIGVSLLTLQNPFFKVIGDNLTAEAEKNGYEAMVLYADEDVVKQGNQVKDFIVRNVSAIVLSPCNADSIGPIIKEANDAGIPVFTVDIPCNLPGIEITSQIATDNFGGGEEAGRAMIEALAGAGGKIAILHFKQAESCRLRVKGFKKVLTGYNETAVAKIEIVTELEGGGAKAMGYRATEDILQSHPDLVGIFAINDPSALGARGALENASKEDQVVIVGFDGQPEGKQAIKDGKIYADPIQFPDRMGIEVVQAIIKHSKGEKVPKQILIPTKLYRQADGANDPDLK
jgi:ribose transport system substrate-binding protein